MAVPGHLAPSYHSLAITHSLSPSISLPAVLSLLFMCSLFVILSMRLPVRFRGAFNHNLSFLHSKGVWGSPIFLSSFLLFLPPFFCFFCGLQIECVFQIKSLKSGGNEGNYAVFEKCCVSDIDGIAFRGTLSTAHCVFCILWKAVLCR